MNKAKIFGVSTFAAGVLLLGSLPAAAQEPVNLPTAFGVSAPLGELAKMPQAPTWGFHLANPVRRVPKRVVNGNVVDPVEQNSVATPSANYTVGANFLGVGNGFPNYSVPDAPPDTNMAVGDTQIVQWVNVSYTVCSKTSPYTCGAAIDGNALWRSGIPGTACANNNDGDPIAQWDVKAHRWLLTQNVFASPYAVCVAVSTSPDANGSYFVAQYPVPGNGFPDYPKWGVWPTNYGSTVNDFGVNGSGFVGPQVCVYNRTKLLAGNNTAEQVCHLYSSGEDGLFPADQDSPTNPPTGQDQLFIGSLGDVDLTHLSLYSAHINNPNDWSQGVVFTGDNNSQLVQIATYNPACNGGFGGACVPQKGIPDLLDSLGFHPMYRFAYWEDQPPANVTANPVLPVPAQHWLLNVDVTASGGQMGIRWMEFTAPIKKVDWSALHVFQQGTYAPNGNWRWMGSLARDKKGDILLGYSESCGDNCPGGTPMYPSIYIAGRQVNDPLGLGNLESEVQVVAGSGSQPATANRWGDYSSMRIDQDGCTFWYTTEYYKVTAQFDWSTQINSAKFSNCQ